MATLTQLRDYVRRQTETTSAELPNTTIDAYLREAFNRTVNRIPDWPDYEASWVLTLSAGDATIDLPSDVNRQTITSLVNLDANIAFRLRMINQRVAEEVYLTTPATTDDHVEFSLWGRKIYLWPSLTFEEDRTYLLRAYRLPNDWVADGDSAEPDIDERLHWPLAHYAVALAYAQQEDEVLEGTYMKRWELDVQSAIDAIMKPIAHRPLIMGGGYRRRA